MPGRQSEARGLDISNTMGDPSSSIRVRVKGLLEEQLQLVYPISWITISWIISWILDYLDEQLQSKHQQLQSQQMHGFLAHHTES